MMEKMICGPMPSYISLAEHMPAQVFVFSAEGRFVYVNPSFCRFAGLSRNELLGRRAHECIPANTGNDKHFPVLQGAGYHERVMKSGKTLIREELLVSCRQRKKCFKVVYSPVFDEDGKLTGTQGIRIDITREKKLESELLLVNGRREAFNKVFNQNIHDIRTLMHAILEFSNRMKNPRLSAEERNDCVNIVVENGYGLLNTMENFMNSSYNNCRAEELVKEIIDVFDVCHTIFQTFEALPQTGEGIEFLFNPPQSPVHDVSIHTDLYRFTYILTTLLSQAFNLTSGGSIHFGYTQKAGKISFYIKDSGLCYPAEMRKALLCPVEKKNYRLSDSEDLFLCKSYVHQLGGRIQVQSDPEQGTCFYVTFPMN